MSSLKNPRVLAFIIGEVTRQGHNVFKEEGAQRVIWMAEAWDVALSNARNKQNGFPSLTVVLLLGALVEPQKNIHPTRLVNVGVGSYIAPNAGQVGRLLRCLWESKDLYTPDEFYVEFEKIHPFVDGNGRVGKILHNWMLGKLEDPVLVKDYFGHGLP